MQHAETARAQELAAQMGAAKEAQKVRTRCNRYRGVAVCLHACVRACVCIEREQPMVRRASKTARNAAWGLAYVYVCNLTQLHPNICQLPAAQVVTLHLHT
jgi:hypothetical protein